MKILVLGASPRKGGNSDVLCDRFMEGAKEAGHETEKIRLSEKALSPCGACYGCLETMACVKADGMGEIREKMLAADVVVLSSPVYFLFQEGGGHPAVF